VFVAVGNDALINALRSLNFTFKRQADRVMIWKQKGSTLRVSVRRNVSHDEEYAATVLKQAGMGAQEIKAFLASCKS
jgi:hypothetical protein